MLNNILWTIFKIFILYPLTVIFGVYVLNDVWHLYHLPWALPSREILVGIAFAVTIVGSRFGMNYDGISKVYSIELGKEYLDEKYPFVGSELAQSVYPFLLCFVVWVNAYVIHYLLDWYGYFPAALG